MTERKRFARAPGVRTHEAKLSPPFSTMSLAEGLVYQALEQKGVAFSYRWFDGNAPTVKELVKGWAPEFTLTEYKKVITVIGGFYGTLPDVINQAALAQVALEMDGWHLVYLYESDIRTLGATVALETAMPELKNPAFHGVVRFGPYGMPDLMSKLRQIRASQTHRFRPKVDSQKDRSNGSGRIGRRRYRKRFGGDRVRRGSGEEAKPDDAGSS